MGLNMSDVMQKRGEGAKVRITKQNKQTVLLMERSIISYRSKCFSSRVGEVFVEDKEAKEM